jgi:hypothetical protein
MTKWINLSQDMDGPGIDSRWGTETGRGAHPASYTMGALEGKFVRVLHYPPTAI